METLYIQGLDTMYPNGYNFDSGGHENKIVSEETKRKMFEAHTKWTKEEDLFLRNNYKTMNKDELMSGLNRAWRVIYRRAHRLNLGSRKILKTKKE